MLSGNQVKKKFPKSPFPSDAEPSFFVYMLRCKSGEFYTGFTNDVARRLRQHDTGAASRYTRSRRPVELVFLEKCANRPAALRREAQIKKLSRIDKLALSRGFARSKVSHET